MPYVFNLCYLLLLVICSPLLVYAAIAKGKYRQGWGAKFFGRVPKREGDDFCVWIHAVSVGEVNLLQPLLERMQQLRPQWEVVISTTTKTGYELARRKYAPRSVFYCPLDFTWATKKALRRIRPNLLLLAELEIWPNLVRYARKWGADVAIVNGRLSERSYRGYRRIRPLIVSVLRRMSFIAVQSETYAERFSQLGAVGKVAVTGSLKFDGAETDRMNQRTRELAQLAGIGEQDIVFLAGSTQSGEEKAAVEVFQALHARFPNLRLIVVPRHPERFDDVAQLLEESGVSWQRRSRLGQESDSADGLPRQVLLVDAIGELAAWWGTSQVAFVGGSWGARGGQNMIEPAAYGAAVSFGPRTENFRDVVALLLAADAAIVVDGRHELEKFVLRCLEEPDWSRLLGQRAKQAVLAHRGATDRTMDLILRQADSDS